MSEDKVTCRTPTEGKSGTTNIPKWKFDLLRDAILNVLSKGPVPFSRLSDSVRKHLSDTDLENLGSLGWHITCVKLELEVRGEIARQKQAGRQMLARTN